VSPTKYLLYLSTPQMAYSHYSFHFLQYLETYYYLDNHSLPLHFHPYHSCIFLSCISLTCLLSVLLKRISLYIFACIICYSRKYINRVAQSDARLGSQLASPTPHQPADWSLHSGWFRHLFITIELTRCSGLARTPCQIISELLDRPVTFQDPNLRSPGKP